MKDLLLYLLIIMALIVIGIKVQIIHKVINDLKKENNLFVDKIMERISCLEEEKGKKRK